MTVKVVNKLTEKVRVWVTSHDVFPGSHQAWYPIESGKSETWSRSAENKVTIEYAGKEYYVATSGHDTFVLTKLGVIRKGSTLKASKVWKLLHIASGKSADTFTATVSRNSTSKLSSGVQSLIKSSLKSGGDLIGCKASIEAELFATSLKKLTEEYKTSNSQTFHWGRGQKGYLYTRETYVGIGLHNGAESGFTFEDGIFQTFDKKQTRPGFVNDL